jgi:acetyl-CoA carboxylase biotin carboxylase subunit
VPIEYDPLLAKLIAYGEDRPQAISRLLRALSEYFVGGIKTNILLFRRILSDSDFQAGKLDTGYLERLLKSTAAGADCGNAHLAAIAAGLFNVLDSASTRSSNGHLSSNANDGTGTESVGSGWKQRARAESLR